jgi:hypothetical protein
MEAAVDYSITEVLHDWMLSRRIITDVAREMGMNSSTLAAKLRPNAIQSHLNADELLPLFKAARKAGYGKELDGILHHFMREAEGAESVKPSSTSLLTQVRSLITNSAMLFDSADRISKMKDPKEIRALRTMVSTEMLPVMLQVDSLLDRRLTKILKRARPATVIQESTDASHPNP